MAEQKPLEEGMQFVPSPDRKQIDRKADDVPTYYANFMGIVGTSHDICLRFGLILESTPDKLEVEHVARVFMSPSHAKAVRDLLNRKIAMYERIFPGWKNPAHEVDDEAPKAD